MDNYLVRGGNRLYGTTSVHGAKNSVLPILAATLLGRGVSVLHNCPRLADVDASVDILTYLGCKVTREGDVLTVDASALTRCDIPDRLTREMRSSVIFLGGILARTGEAVLSYPGGCELGPRPIDLHLFALRSLGAQVFEEGGMLCCVGNHMRGATVMLSIPSVGATENAMLAACGA
ncbi:MAG: UDP-N-acetylglucosamine 1-carboxyvinyltransferase, partial [Clostridiales bacterium]|nr:UDP-N-acetylglucosamine 1-carboxyvinyltransferase [Clostridiales bacterium]